jgi:type IV fimbrial biogenesis protein FimT
VIVKLYTKGRSNNAGIQGFLLMQDRSDQVKAATKTSKTGIQTASFVGCKHPFVRSTKSINTPLVGLNRPNASFRVAGFTTVELLVTIAVAAVLLTLAVPSMRTLIQNMRMTSQANDLISDINFARSEAIKRSANVTICQSADSTAASPTCSTGADWKVGRIIFIDSDSDGQHASTEELLRIREPLDGNNTLTSGVNLVVYARNGATTAGAKIDFNLCDTRGASAGRNISIEATGRAAITKPPAGC